MRFKNEKAFEAHLRRLIRTHILSNARNLVLLKSKKTVDMLICRNGVRPKLYFIEVKYHKKSRIGTGHGKGGGIQPEILKIQPDYFARNMRWILGQKKGSGYLFLTNKGISKFLSDGEIGKKYNNIRPEVFQKVKHLTQAELLDELKAWHA